MRGRGSSIYETERHTYKFVTVRRTFSGYIIAKASRNYQPWDIFQSRLRLSGPIEPEIEWIVCTTVTATAITSLSPARRTTHPPRCITIVNSIWIAAKLDRTVNYTRMTVRLARICSVDPFERIAIDWLFILFHSFFPLDSACIIGRLKRSKTVRVSNLYAIIADLVFFSFVSFFAVCSIERGTKLTLLASSATLALIKTKRTPQSLAFAVFYSSPACFLFLLPPCHLSILVFVARSYTHDAALAVLSVVR